MAAHRCSRYDPIFIHADADLAQVAAGLVQSKAWRLRLYGPPGTGKTAFGRWLADQMGVPLLVKCATDLMSIWAGMNEKNITRAFKEAEQDGALPPRNSRRTTCFFRPADHCFTSLAAPCPPPVALPLLPATPAQPATPSAFGSYPPFSGTIEHQICVQNNRGRRTQHAEQY